VGDQEGWQRLVLVRYVQHSGETGPPERRNDCRTRIGGRVALFAQMCEHYDREAGMMQLPKQLSGSAVG
jgi:hypothetical protein